MAKNKDAPLRQCRITKWLDGDTFDAEVLLSLTEHIDLSDLGIAKPFEVTVSLAPPVRIRVYGINAPEVHSSDPKEKAAGEAALKQARMLLPEGITVLAKSAGKEKYDRYMANVTMPDGKDFAETMKRAGHARSYYGGKKEPL